MTEMVQSARTGEEINITLLGFIPDLKIPFYIQVVLFHSGKFCYFYNYATVNKSVSSLPLTVHICLKLSGFVTSGH